MSFFSSFLFLTIVCAAFGCDYLQYGADHVMCKYQENKCKPTTRELRTDNIAKILKLLNGKRQTVASGKQADQPSASNMKQLVWDKELAKIGQRMADQCEYISNRNKRSNKYATVGVVDYMFSCTDPKNKELDFSGIENVWFNKQVKLFKSKDINPFQRNPSYYFYAQMMWAETEAVGCGYSYYTKDKKFNKYLACLFGPGGNKQNSVMYKTGDPCSNCPKGCSKEYPALCKLAV